MKKDYETIREIKDFLADAKKNFQEKTCFLCGKPIDGTCNSHSIPRFILKQLGDNSKLYSITSFLDPTQGELSTKGINDCGTFHLICNECDQKYFREYESKQTLNELPKIAKTDDGCKILAEIMLKSCLLEYFKKSQDCLVNKAFNSISDCSEKKMNISSFLDIKEYKEQISKLKNIISYNRCNQFHVSCCRILNHNSQIAGQPLVAIGNDIQGNLINDPFCFDPLYKIADAQFVIFPFDNRTLVLVFCVNDFYQRLKPYLDYLESLSGNRQLRFIQATIFSFSEEIYVTKNGLSTIENDPNSLKFASSSMESARYLKDLKTGELINEFTPNRTNLNGFNKIKLLI